MVGFKRFLAYLAVVAIAIGLGSIIANIGAQIPAMSFLAIMPTFGFAPFNMNLVVLDVTFGMNIHITVAHIIMLIICIFVAPKIVDTLVKK
ncbi:MAG: DUF4321 domain-containing protein [Ruminococcus sp.]|nr:DUF4321 domain-containing protein [Ruminococcus sp.]